MIRSLMNKLSNEWIINETMVAVVSFSAVYYNQKNEWSLNTSKEEIMSLNFSS